jgi:hypothetical protein
MESKPDTNCNTVKPQRSDLPEVKVFPNSVNSSPETLPGSHLFLDRTLRRWAAWGQAFSGREAYEDRVICDRFGVFGIRDGGIHGIRS